MHGDSQLEGLDDVTLTPLVRRALNHETATLLAWQWSPIAYDVFLPGRTLGRFTGTAMTESGERALEQFIRNFPGNPWLEPWVEWDALQAHGLR